MHILFTTYEFVTERKPCGGYGHYLANIATILSMHGHEVTILLTSNNNRSFEWKKKIQVVEFKCEYVNSLFHIEEYIDAILKTSISDAVNRSLTLRKKILEIDKQRKIDIIQNNGDFLEGWHRIRRIPTVIRLSSFPAWYEHAYNPKNDLNDISWLNKEESKLFLYPLAKADAVYGPSKCVADFVNFKLHNKMEVIESPFIKEEDPIEEIILPELKGKKYFLFFGRICILKGVNTIALAIHRILEENPETYFAFAGNVEQKGLMDRILKEAGKYQKRIIILNEIKDKMVMYSVIKNAELCILPSRADNLPNTCIEAMGMKKIVVGSYGASFEQLIQNKKNGLLIKRDSPTALLKAIRYFNGMTPERREKMGNLAALRIEKMKPEVIYQQLISFYRDVIAECQRKCF